MELWTAVKEENGHWAFTWAGAGTFYVWLDGVLLGEAEDGVYDFAQDGYYTTPPPLEITDDPDDAENELYPPTALLQWREVDGATAYYVEAYVSGVWAGRKTIMNAGAGYYAYRTPVIDDQEEASYRVSALDERGNTGTPVVFTFALVHNPAPPEVTGAFAAGDLVIEAV